MNRLILLDGNAIMHRAYHALPPLTAPDGTIVNAVYGFASMLIRLVHDFQPTHVAVVFDRPAPTFRKTLFKDYQIKRPKMDDALSSQIPLTHELLVSFSIPVFEMDGFEADDLIGTIVEYKHQHPGKFDQIIIVTGDRDILQLVEDESVLVYMPVKGLSEGKLFGEKETIERMGVHPRLIPDYKALAGDASDNYPGIPGIGPKTAVDILQKAGSIQALYKTIESDNLGLSPSIVTKIKVGKGSALLSHELATIRKDVPIDILIPGFSVHQFIGDEATRIFERFGFHSLMKRVATIAGKPVKQVKKDVKKEEENSQQLELV